MLNASTVAAERSIGAIISDTRNLGADQVEAIVAYQRQHGVRFGAAAVALGYASADDVLHALAQQFHYPYAANEDQKGSPELVALNQPFGRQAEAIRAIRSQLLMRGLGAQQEDRAALALISPQSGDGRSYFAANLAVALAQLGGRVLLIDADMRAPRQHDIFGLPNETGLSGILAGRAQTQVIQPVAGVPGLCVLPVGVTPPNPVELVERPGFGFLLQELRAKFDYVLVDTPAGSRGADAGVIAARCGHALLIARKDATRVAAVREQVAGLPTSAVQLIGVVVNEH
ncbi:chain length determinant protein tyrosine kinase EpsG [Inhella inkyongensis]|uniref:Chain length determinant protein tyrosine kinase EpsG n=1 Tax=Inhella inkyongensis TaxID=392593 RepID=A0A840S7D4_9BURK|nr:polysaccharide biosynthesis tyrosine autokinase [Inhella inkyongensis]MBB5204359.1 chain length determinant protein tyrosine kinase EpsG [Inhella inkyongensis]